MHPASDIVSIICECLEEVQNNSTVTLNDSKTDLTEITGSPIALIVISKNKTKIIPNMKKRGQVYLPEPDS